MSNEAVIKKIGTVRIRILTIRTREMTFLGCIMRKENYGISQAAMSKLSDEIG